MIVKRYINGVQIAGWVSGEKWRQDLKHLVFIHGSGGDHTNWVCQYSALKTDFNILAVELPGHGASAGKGERSVGGYAEWMRQIIAGFEIEKPILVGHSLGAAICLTMAIHHGDLPAGVVTVGGGVTMWVNPAILEGLLKDPGPIVEMAAKLSLAKQNRDRFSEVLRAGFAKADPLVMQGDFSACNDLNLTEDLKKIGIPVLVVCGTEDKMTPPANSQYLKDHIAGARMALIENAGHFVMMENPEVFNRVLREFAQSI
ncbi:MAG TPA: alpha/beta hydrolase [Syntrophales bacterium]|jgi:pimeloyl-ACP methyl ester carboxylesterase|nr:alpha/beta hydrolase [Syntrophales bacterium]HON22677.1 alpha/beta hydrolase [Syntrophales bacterium]HOU77407.1 alpha/beta hydrolase [Syntrophales bacterium]HPC33485.1 alpha/beta hydrolase [Syntrophales bacterium]HQG35184.1 alpha/beta hydrolase [Syntrophales bacterium]